MAPEPVVAEAQAYSGQEPERELQGLAAEVPADRESDLAEAGRHRASGVRRAVQAPAIQASLVRPAEELLLRFRQTR